MTDLGEASSSSGLIALSGLASRVRSLPAPTPPGRLTSLRTRDLTLGAGLKKPKKAFEPNIHTVRKSKDELKAEIHVTLKKERRERRREPKGRRRDRPQTIQSHSIFEQGPADGSRRSGWGASAHLQDANISPVGRLVKNERSKTEEEEDEILSKLHRDDFIDDPGLRNDAKLKPIQLPLSQSSSSTRTRPESPPLFGSPSCGGQSTASCSGEHVSRPLQPSLVELLQDLSLSGREELFFMQLPDCMPGTVSGQKLHPAVGPAAEKPAKKEDGRPGHRLADDPALTDTCPVLSQLPEGLLGKLQIRKSGKVELKLGEVIMDVSEGAAFSFLQQLVSVRLSEGRTGDMMVLGNIHHKLVLSPDFQALLGQAAMGQQQGP